MIKLSESIKNRTARVGVIGLGYVGLPLAMRFTAVGLDVIGFDVDVKKVKTLAEGRSYIAHIPDASVAKCVAAGLEATTDFSRIAEVDVITICVPTPLNRNREPDMSYIVNSLALIVPHMHKGQLLSLESTTYPGTTEEIVRPALEARGFKVGEDVFLVFSPEREDPGNQDYTTQTIPKVVGGSTPQCLEMGVALYSKIIDRVVPVSSTAAAEMVKILENTHRAVNIGFVNEMKVVADRMGIDIQEVIEAAATKPFGFTKYTPGPGLGGHCIPIDPFYLSWKAREYGVTIRFIELAGEVNHAMPDWVVGKVTEALNLRKKSLNGSRVLVLGIAYKKNIDDMRESPAVRVMEILRGKGAEVS
jgi:UDP-N-acetyl-D-glucosamine dehydrogenase